MIYTDRFVYVHQPKTGGSFVTVALYRVHLGGVRFPWARKLWNLPRRVHRYGGKYGHFAYDKNKHGVCREIPEAHQGKPILASVRSPYDRYVSQYEFGWWKKRRWLKYYRQVPRFADRYPDFPDVSFEQYVRMANEAFNAPVNRDWHDSNTVGSQTEDFVNYFFRRPGEALHRLGSDYENYVKSGAARADMYDLRIIHTYSLNEDLHAFLAGEGYAEEDIEFIRHMGRVLPGGKGRRRDQKWQQYYSRELKEWVRHKERLLFELFPEFDV